MAIQWLKKYPLSYLLDFFRSEKIGAFASGVNRLFRRADILREWRAIVMRENITTLGYHHDVRLADYLKDVEMALDKSEAFDRMLKFFSRRTREAGAA